MLSCRQATELMSQEQDRRLSLAERLGLRLHVLICAACENYRRQMVAVPLIENCAFDALLSMLPDAAVPSVSAGRVAWL